MSELFPKSIELKKTSLPERIIVAKVLLQSVLDDLPSVQPRKGKWIRTRTLMHDGELYCDQCGQEHPEQKKIWNFCPNCGCRMEEGEQDG